MMNRLPRVETTRDKEKRAVFKEQLAARLIDAPVIVQPELVPEINGVPIGGSLFHQQFGEGSLKAISKTQVIVEFSLNTVSFIPSVAKSQLSPVEFTQEGPDRFEETFIDPIVRPDPVSGVAYRDVSFKELPPAPKPKEIRPSSHFEGRTVWHPDFGACFVVSVNHARNEIILQTNGGENVTLALRALESKLAIIPDNTNLVLGKTPTKYVV